MSLDNSGENRTVGSFVSPSSEFSILKKIDFPFRNLSLTEKVILITLIALLSFSIIGILWKINNHFLVTVPSYEGTLKEGIVGIPGPINPLLASSSVDKDLIKLIYSGLMKATPEGELTGDLSEYHTISEDGLEYTFSIRDNAYFHDGVPVTANDVVFTIEKVKNPSIRSDLRGQWLEVDAEVLNKSTVKITLPEPRPEFLEYATLGIIPKHIWENVESNRFPISIHNVEPIGSGPFWVEDIRYDDQNNPREYRLKSFDEYVHGKPFIDKLVLSFYSSEREAFGALIAGSIDSLYGVSPRRAEELERRNFVLKSGVLPRVFAIFLNQNNNEVFTDSEIREILNKNIDRKRIVREVLYGYGNVITGPTYLSKQDPETEDFSPEDLRDELIEAGLDYDEETGYLTNNGEIFSLNLTTLNTDDLKQVLNVIKEGWRMAGIDVNLEFYGSSELNQNIIRPRNFEALLFGYVLDRDIDLFPFWHSSQRNDPGANISLYANIQVDSLLEEFQRESDKDRRLEIIKEIEEEINEDIPSFFLYSPNFIYAIPDSLQNITLGHLTSSDERFLNIHNWFLKTNRIWNIFLYDSKKEIKDPLGFEKENVFASLY